MESEVAINTETTDRVCAINTETTDRVCVRERWEKVLVVGATGYVGSHIAVASVNQGHETYVLVRPRNLFPLSRNFSLIQSFKDLKIHIIQGDLDDQESLVEAVKKVDVVVSAVSVEETMKQMNIINAIRKAGARIKRFLPSEFGNEYHRVGNLLPPYQEVVSQKLEIRKALQDAGIPFTAFCANCLAKYFVYVILGPQNLDEVLIFGDGTAKACFNLEEDVAAMVIKVATDERCVNKAIVYRPPENVMSQEELVKMWEIKASKCLKRKYMPESEIVRLAECHCVPLEKLRMSIAHSIFVKGDGTSFSATGTEASMLFPDYAYTSVEKYLEMCSVSPSCIQVPNSSFMRTT